MNKDCFMSQTFIISNKIELLKFSVIDCMEVDLYYEWLSCIMRNDCQEAEHIFSEIIVGSIAWELGGTRVKSSEVEFNGIEFQ